MASRSPHVRLCLEKLTSWTSETHDSIVSAVVGVLICLQKSKQPKLAAQ